MWGVGGYGGGLKDWRTRNSREKGRRGYIWVGKRRG